MPWTEIVTVIVILAILIMYVYGDGGSSEVEYKTGLDGRRYLVRSMPDSQAAADLLADINMDLVLLVQHMVAKYPNNDDVLNLWRKFDPLTVSEGSIESGYTSYSVNKGEKIILCIRQRDDSFVDKNVLLYVAIHELAHIMTHEVGHTTLFWGNFRFLLNDAIDIGVYRRVDFDNRPEDYCGIQIASSVI